MDTTVITQALEQMPSQIDHILDIFFVSLVTEIWVRYQVIILLALFLDVLIIITGISMGRPNRMPPFINRYVGKVTYLLFAIIIFFIFYFWLGPMVIDSEWFMLSGILSYPTTKVFLRDIIHFWDY